MDKNIYLIMLNYWVKSSHIMWLITIQNVAYYNTKGKNNGI